MLSQCESAAIQRTIQLILKAPDLVTRKEFIETYNCIYSYCNAHTERYGIRGGEIYEIVDSAIEEFARKFEFKGSISLFARQIHSLDRIMDLFEKIFNYLERFFIRVSILNQADVKLLRDLFFYKLYFHFIYRIEENLQSLILLEIDTVRNAYKQEISDLKSVIVFYMNCLSNNNLETNKKHFYQRYLRDFRESTDFNCEIGRLMKKIYIEAYFAITVLSDKEITREIVQSVIFRKDEIFGYTFSLISKFEKFKHFYIIISRMPDTIKSEFKKKYEDFVHELFRNSVGFPDIHSNYANVFKQVEDNKLVGFDDLICSVLKKTFAERPISAQAEIHAKMVDSIDKLVLQSSNIEELYNDSLYIIFEIFSAIFDERLINLYTEAAQIRLLKGIDPEHEHFLSYMLQKKIGRGSISQLKNSIDSFINKSCFTFEPAKLKASCVKIAKGFWDLEKCDTVLHPTLDAIKKSIAQNIEIPERYILEFNVCVSPVTFTLNNTLYRMRSDAVSLLLFIVDVPGIEHDELKTHTSDPHFDENINTLLNNNFIACLPDFIGMRRYKALDKRSSQSFVDLFDVFKKHKNVNDPVSIETHVKHVLEAKVCKFMKRNKECSFDHIEGVFPGETSLRETLSNLASKGYLEIEEQKIHYVP